MSKCFFIAFSTLLSATCFAGAWGVGSFENDSALDWSYELKHSKSSVVLLSAFNSVQGSGYIEVDACSAAMAAADIVASIKANSFGKLPDDVKKWAISNSLIINEALVSSAKKAVASCVDESNSELAQLWRESSNKEWEAYVSELNSRLK